MKAVCTKNEEEWYQNTDRKTELGCIHTSRLCLAPWCNQTRYCKIKWVWLKCMFWGQNFATHILTGGLGHNPERILHLSGFYLDLVLPAHLNKTTDWYECGLKRRRERQSRRGENNRRELTRRQWEIEQDKRDKANGKIHMIRKAGRRKLHH